MENCEIDQRHDSVEYFALRWPEESILLAQHEIAIWIIKETPSKIISVSIETENQAKHYNRSWGATEISRRITSYLTYE